MPADDSDPSDLAGRIGEVERWVASQLPAALGALAGPGQAISAAFAGAVPDKPGLYAVYGEPEAWKTLGLGAPPDDRPLYVGKAEDSLVSRDLNTHFSSGRTGWSSPRRSFAALLVDALALVATPRRPDRAEPKRWANYALETEGDERLTAWMRELLTLAVWPCDVIEWLEAIELAVMGHWRPPLNLTGVQEPWRRQVKAARAAMAVAAKRWIREHGHEADEP